jgi:hypothetical protein
VRPLAALAILAGAHAVLFVRRPCGVGERLKYLLKADIFIPKDNFIVLSCIKIKKGGVNAYPHQLNTSAGIYTHV